MLLALVILAGCYPEDRFVGDFDEAVCAWKSACYAEDEAACLSDAEAARTDHACDYDSHEAHVCVAGLKDLECPGDTGAEEAFGFPEACDAVWDCR